MKILIIRLSSMGDVIIQSSVARQLKTTFPQAQIDILTSQEFHSLVNKNEDYSEVFCYQRKSGLEDLKELFKMGQRLNQQKYDLILDLHDNTRTRFLEILTTAPMLKVDKRSWARKLLVKFKWNFLGNTSSQHFRTIEDFAFLGLGEGILDQEGLTKIDSRITSPEDKIVISPVASFASKRWGMSSYAELIDLILADKELSSFKIEIIAGPADDYCQNLGLGLSRVSNLQGKTSLDETIEKISESKICVTNDTGSLHIAESFRVPVVAIFGATSPFFGFKPHLKKSEFIYAGSSCSPCSTTGSKPCSQARQHCMLDIQAEEVYSKIKKILLRDTDL